MQTNSVYIILTHVEGYNLFAQLAEGRRIVGKLQGVFNVKAGYLTNSDPRTVLKSRNLFRIKRGIRLERKGFTLCQLI